jgi:hypothetical protein
VPVAGTRAVCVRVGRYALELGMNFFKPVIQSLEGCEVERLVFDGGRVRAARERHAGETQEGGRPAFTELPLRFRPLPALSCTYKGSRNQILNRGSFRDH